jgi:hypothetical protein
MFSLTGLVNFLLYLIVAGLIFWLLSWLIDYVGVPDPFQKVARVVLAVAAVFVVIYALLSLVGGAPPLFRP